MDRESLFLPHPKRGSHKGQNGVLLIIGGNRTYHGAPILAALAAMRFCDLVYFYSAKQNAQALKKMRAATPNVICVEKGRLAPALAHADCVLVGNGMEPGRETAKMVEKILRTGKKCVLDAAAIKSVPKEWLHSGVILTPHAIEFKTAFGVAATEKSVGEMSKKYGCTILFKGERDIVASCGKAVKIKGGNAGMTKGGTGDVLAGLLAAIYSHPSCPSPMKAACAASYLNKRAGDMLFRVMSYNYSSEDLALELSHAAWGLYKA